MIIQAPVIKKFPIPLNVSLIIVESNAYVSEECRNVNITKDQWCKYHGKWVRSKIIGNLSSASVFLKEVQQEIY